VIPGSEQHRTGNDFIACIFAAKKIVNQFSIILGLKVHYFRSFRIVMELRLKNAAKE